MMNNFFPFGGFGLGIHLHFFFGFLVFLALVLFGVLAIRYLKKEELISWIKGLLIVGLIGWLLTATFAFGWMGKAWQNGKNFGPGMMRGFGNCLEDQDCNRGMRQMMNFMNKAWEDVR